MEAPETLSSKSTANGQWSEGHEQPTSEGSGPTFTLPEPRAVPRDIPHTFMGAKDGGQQVYDTSLTKTWTRSILFDHARMRLKMASLEAVSSPASNG